MLELPVVAWMDDGQQAANGTEGTAFRVVTNKTKAGMPNAAVVSYTDPLVRRSDAMAYASLVLEAAKATLAEAAYDAAIRYANGHEVDWKEVIESAIRDIGTKEKP